MKAPRIAALLGGGLATGVALAVAPVAVAGGGITAEREVELERLVRQDCGSCHGMRLKGGLGPAIDAEALAGRDARTIAAIILDGIPGTPMPPWRPLISEEEAEWIADYLLRAE